MKVLFAAIVFSILTLPMLFGQETSGPASPVVTGNGNTVVVDKPATPPVQGAQIDPRLTVGVYQYSVVEKASQNIIVRKAAPLIKEAEKLIAEHEKLSKAPKNNEQRLAEITKRLIELNGVVAEVSKGLVLDPTKGAK